MSRSWELRVGAGTSSLTTSRAVERERTACGSIALCTGGTDKPRRLNIEGEDLPHVSHYFRDPHEFFGRKLLIVGGKNSAVEAALRSHHAGAEVSLSYRRAELDARHIKYWLTPEINSLISAQRIHGHFNSLPTRITETAVELRGPDGRSEMIPADFVLLLIGYEADLTLLELAGVKLEGSSRAPAFDPATMQSSVPGIYVAGTATGGTQEKYSLFIENCHVHVERIIASLKGAAPPATPVPNDRPES